MRLRTFVVPLVIILSRASAAQAATCESLQALALPNVTITVAQSVPAGAFTPPDPQAAAAFSQLMPFCRVAATLRPSADSEIKIEVWMPLSDWNGKFQGVGGGGLGGVISYTGGRGGIERGMAEAVKRGYATASTDTGHVGATATPFLGHPEKVADYGWRAVHEMTVAAKAIVNTFYGTGPRLSYWNGCSLGGRQGLMEAQRFPADYDGIVAGAPANPQTRLSAWNVYVGQAALADPARTIPASKFPMIHTAVINACDASDGLKDGLIGDPTRCAFDFKTLECKDKDLPSCLTPAQVESARIVTSPAVHSKTKEVIFPGLMFGAELGWGTKIGGPSPNALGTEWFKYVWFNNPQWDWRTFELESAVAIADRLDAGTVNAINPDLTRFRERGGKLLLYHGLSDQNFSAQTTINYYRTVLGAMGSDRSDEWLRLFLAPGVGHCGGGDGPNSFDPLAALEQWVENGRPPATIIASRVTGGRVERTRPLCSYPQVAQYGGNGSIDEAASFTCALPRQ